MTIETQAKGYRRWLLLAALVFLVFAMVYWYAQVRCYLFYAECNPMLDVPVMPNWTIPTAPLERAAYDHAHGLKLPETFNIKVHEKMGVLRVEQLTSPELIPKPVPFDFKAARVKEIETGREVADQYFEHLCRSEDGEYIIRTVENVEGVYLMRPRRREKNKAPDFDRYGTEEPMGIVDDHSDPDLFNQYGESAPRNFLQPMFGQYLYLEQPDWEQPDQLIRYVRQLAPIQPAWARNGVQSGGIRLPSFIVREQAKVGKARYGITWRGIRRPRDREFAIAGGELLIVDLQSNEVMAVRRVFGLSGKYYKKDGIWWANSRHCRVSHTPHISIDSRDFALRVLHPLPNINNGYEKFRVIDQAEKLNHANQ